MSPMCHAEYSDKPLAFSVEAYFKGIKAVSPLFGNTVLTHLG